MDKRQCWLALGEIVAEGLEVHDLAKDPAEREQAVIEALKARDAEASARAILPKAEDAERKGDFAGALALFKKIVALGETSLKTDCEAKASLTSTTLMSFQDRPVRLNSSRTAASSVWRTEAHWAGPWVAKSCPH